MNEMTTEVFEGELLLPEEKVRFFLFEHALKANRKVCEVPAGLSVTEALSYALETCQIEKPKGKFAVYLQDGSRVPEYMWSRVRLKAGTAVVGRPIAEAPIFAIFAAISAVFSGIGAFFAGLGFFGKLLLWGIGLGAKLLLSKLFQPKQNNPAPSDAVPSYSVSASRNQLNQWGAIPLLLGRHRFAPPLAAAPYTESVGDEQYLRQLFCNGYGPMYLEEATAKIGDTLVSSYSEAEIQHRYGYSIAESKTTLYPSSVIDLQLGEELKQVEAPVVHSTATDTTQVAMDFLWPSGLYNLTKDGNDRPRSMVLSFYYAPMGSTAWVAMPTYTMTLETQRATRRSIYFSFPYAGQWDVRVHKESADPDPNAGPGQEQAIETTIFVSMRSFRTGEPVTFSDAPLSFTALRIRASGRLNQIIDTYNVIAWSRVTAFNGSYWVANTPSRNPADIYRWVLQCGANRRPYSDAKIDFVALQAWWAYCYNKGWYYDKIINEQTSVFDLLTEICAAGRAMPVFKDGKWSVVWDDQTVPIVQLFTPRNSWNFEETRDLDPIPHGYRIRFPNETKGWVEDERIVYNDGYSKANATLLEGFQVPGVTHTDRVWKHGRFHLAQRLLRPGTFSIYTSWDALALIRGDRVRINYDTFQYGLYSGRVVAVDVPNQTVTIDTNVLLAGATNYMFRFRLVNGTFLERSIDPGYVGEYTIIGLVGDGLPMPNEGDLFSLGYSSMDSRVMRVVGIEPQDDLVHHLIMVDDAPEIAYADIGQIPDYNAGITPPIDPFLLPPRNIQISDGVYWDGGTQYWANLDITWEGPAYGRVAAYEIQYREQNDQPNLWTSAVSVGPQVNSYELRKLKEGIYTIRIRCIFDNGSFSNWTVSPAKATTEYSTPPPDVTNFRITTMGDISILRWDEIKGVGITYEIRYAPMGATEPDWNAATFLITAITNSIQIGTRTGTFFIKARKPWGVASVNAKLLFTAVGSLTNLNFVSQIREDDTFIGTKTGVEVVDSELRLAADPTYTNFVTEGIYLFHQQIDLGEFIDARLTVFLDAYGFNPQTSMAKWITLESVNPLDSIEKSQWSAIPEYRTSNVGSPYVWSDWQQVGVTDVVAWAIQFRIRLSAEEQIDIQTNNVRAIATPSIQQLWVDIDMADRIEKGEDVLCPAAGITITYPNGRYRVPPAVVITPQDMAQGDYYKVDQKTDTSFRVRFWNASNVLKSLTFDWMSKGWGRVQ